MPKAVKMEVASEDLVKNYPDAALISALMSKGSIKIQSPGSDNRLPLPISLHKGEEEAMLLAIKLESSLLATDDGKAIKAARFFKARKSLEKLSKIGRYSPEIIAAALISLMEKENGKAHNHKDT